jgi:hypothetical protein
MKLRALIAAGLLAISTGCVFHKKPQAATPPAPTPAATPAKPPADPLSIPQTHVQLPPPQPLDPQALVVAAPPQTPLAAPATVQTAPAPSRRASSASNSQARPETPPPVTADPAPLPARASIQEVMPDSQRSQLQEQWTASRKRIRAWLDSAAAQHLNGQDKLKRDRIQSFLKASDDAERRGDMREAVQLADLAEVLIRELQGGR